MRFPLSLAFLDCLGLECCKNLAKENLEREGIASESSQLKSSQVLILVPEESALLWQGWEDASGKSGDSCRDLHTLKPLLFKKAGAFYVESLLFYGAHVGLGKIEAVNL